jgi:hypothetical protein
MQGAKGCNMESNPVAAPRLAATIENPPLATIVNPIFIDAFGESPALRPDSIPAALLPMIENRTALKANHAASLNAIGSMVRPKLKNRAPKKSRNEKIIFSMRLICIVPAETSPTRSTPPKNQRSGTAEKAWTLRWI